MERCILLLILQQATLGAVSARQRNWCGGCRRQAAAIGMPSYRQRYPETPGCLPAPFCRPPGCGDACRNSINRGRARLRTARRKRAVQQQNVWLPSSDRMRLLVVCDGARHEVVATSDMTARDIRTRVSTGDGVLTRGLGPSAVVLDEEVALSEQGVADRDRLILTTATSGTALGAALCALSTSAVKIDQLAAQLAAGTPAHEEFYTRVLVELDCTQAFDRCAQCARRLKANPSVTQSPAVADCPRPSGTNAGGGGRLWCSERRRGLRQRRQRLCVLVESHWPQARLRLHGARTAVRIGQRLSLP